MDDQAHQVSGQIAMSNKGFTFAALAPPTIVFSGEGGGPIAKLLPDGTVEVLRHGKEPEAAAWFWRCMGNPFAEEIRRLRARVAELERCQHDGQTAP